MKRILQAFLILVVVACLAGAVLALTVLRPREEILPSFIEDNGGPKRSRIQITYRWSLEPPQYWGRFGRNGFAACGHYGQTLQDGWQYGPFSFVKERRTHRWPVAVEKAARLALAKKPWAGKASLAFLGGNDGWLMQREHDDWYVMAHASKNEYLLMIFTEEGKPVHEDTWSSF